VRCEIGAAKAMDVAGCCPKSKDRVLVEKRKPGALWHIYEAQDSDKIRDLLKKVIFVRSVDIGPFLTQPLKLVTKLVAVFCSILSKNNFSHF